MYTVIVCLSQPDATITERHHAPDHALQIETLTQACGDTCDGENTLCWSQDRSSTHMEQLLNDVAQIELLGTQFADTYRAVRICAAVCTAMASVH